MSTHLPVLQPKSSLSGDGHRNFVYPADVKGRFTRLRKAVFLVLIAVYVALPWVKIHGHPAVFLDIMRRQFFLFGATFNAQDIWLVAFILTGGAFGLVYATAVLGRVWCGYACPQTVFLEGVYRRVERWIEGPREKRMRRDQAGWTFDKVWRKALLHATWVSISLALAHAFLAYFVSIPQLFAMMRHEPSEHPEAFAVVMGLSAIFYFNFSWFREQFCVVLCPYGRQQSVLLDTDSLVVGYDIQRGEPRGKAKDPRRGDCVDCGRCVAVCPTGIDIRNGLQMDCIACAECIDACDEVMDKLGQARGLVRYDSQNGLLGKPKRVWRPRVALYTGLGVLGLAVATFAFSKHERFEANVLRVQGAPYVLDGDTVRNSYRLHLVNKEGEATTFHVEPEDSPNVAFTVPLNEVHLESLGSADTPFFAIMPRSAFAGERKLRIVVRTDEGDRRVMEAPFLGPNAR